VRQGRAPRPAPLTVHLPPHASPSPLDTTALTEQEYGLVRSFLERRSQLDPRARAALAAQLGSMVRTRTEGAQAYAWDEALLEAVVVAVQQRFRQSEPPPA
jgi:hypothetical protein